MSDEKKKILDFLIEANKLKDVKRTGWMMVKVKDPESVAAHVFSVSLMASLFAEKMKIDKQKLLDMVLIHDLCEVYAGDIATRKDGMMFLPDKKGKIRRFVGNKDAVEEKAMKKILKKLPDELGKEYYRLWREFLENRTKEAKIAHELDKLDYAILAFLYKDRGIKKIDRFVYVQDILKNKFLKDLSKLVLKRFYE
jgi:putative hydrolase of HD superfamily